MFNALIQSLISLMAHYQSRMTVNADDRTQLSVFRNLGSQSALFIAGIAVVPLVSKFDNHAIGYPVVVGMLAIFGVIFHLICYKGVKERHAIERPKRKASIRKPSST